MWIDLPIPLSGGVHVSQDVEWIAQRVAGWGWMDNSLQDTYATRVMLRRCWSGRKSGEKGNWGNIFETGTLTSGRGWMMVAACHSRSDTPRINLAIQNYCESRRIYGHGRVWQRFLSPTSDTGIPCCCLCATPTQTTLLLSGNMKIHIVTLVL